MTEIHSFDAKVERAEQHLSEIERIIAAYLDAHPYEAYLDGSTWRFRFTAQPDAILSVLVGEFLYQLRSALDHLRAALVPKSRERSGYFPIHFAGVWDPPVPGERQDRADARVKWTTSVRGMTEEAIEILRRTQPADEDPEIYNLSGLVILNRLSVKERHVRLPVVASRLADPIRVAWTDASGVRRQGVAAEEERTAIADGTPLPPPADATEVTLSGTPVVVVQLDGDVGGFLVPDAFREQLLPDTRRVLDLLRPFARLV